MTLESLGDGPLRTACITVGTPHRDADGYIDNAVLFSPFYSGDAGLMYFYWYRGQGANDFCGGPVVGPGELIDTDRYYVIFLDALGLWGAGKPSDGLGLRFPQYNILDCVQANYRLLRDHLKVSRVTLATGASMGAIQSYLWALMHPGFVEAIMPMGGVTETDASLRWLFRLMSAAIESDPAWRDTAGDYYHLPKEKHPNRGVMFGWSILFQSAMSFDYRIQTGWDEVQKEAFAWDLQGKEGALLVPYGRNYDAIDLLYRNRAGESLNVTGELHRIRARTLILHVANDHWVRLCMARRPTSVFPARGSAPSNTPWVTMPSSGRRMSSATQSKRFSKASAPTATGRERMNRDAVTIFNAALGAVDPYAAVKDHVDRIRTICREDGLTKIYVVGSRQGGLSHDPRAR